MTSCALIRTGRSHALLAISWPIRIWSGQDLIFFLSDRCMSRADSISLALIGTDIAFYTYSKLQTYFLRKTSNDGVVSADSRQLFYQISLNRCNNQRRRWSSWGLTRYVFVSRILFPSALPVLRSSKKIAVSIKSQPIKTPVCFLSLMHIAIVSKRNSTPSMLLD